MVIWLIGMSASGKTTIAREMIKKLKHSSDDRPWVLLDGDEVRALAGCDVDHTVEGRRKNAERICKCCAELDAQGKNVLACVLSIFHESQDWLRENIYNYKQVYIKVNYDVLKVRDNKHLYLNAERGLEKNVVGVDIEFPEPKQSDVIIENNKDSDPLELAEIILHKLNILPPIRYKYCDGDLLDTPNKYQYTHYEGEQFLRAYRESRENAIGSLKSGRRNLTLCDVLKFYAITITKKESNVILTREYLQGELTDIVGGAWQAKERLDTFLTLVQRFEVSKKVYVHYRSLNFKKIDNDYTDLVNFILFHVLLSEVCSLVDKQFSIICTNSLLKVGDILISIKDKLVGHEELLAFALNQELLLMKEQFDV